MPNFFWARWNLIRVNFTNNTVYFLVTVSNFLELSNRVIFLNFKKSYQKNARPFSSKVTLSKKTGHLLNPEPSCYLKHVQNKDTIQALTYESVSGAEVGREEKLSMQPCHTDPLIGTKLSLGLAFVMLKEQQQQKSRWWHRCQNLNVRFVKCQKTKFGMFVCFFSIA